MYPIFVLKRTQRTSPGPIRGRDGSAWYGSAICCSAGADGGLQLLHYLVDDDPVVDLGLAALREFDLLGPHPAVVRDGAGRQVTRI